MLRTRLYRYKLSEFSHLTGIDTYRLKKLDQQGILPARTINGRRYYDETAVMLAAFYSDCEYTKPTIHNIVITLDKLLTLIKMYNKKHGGREGQKSEFEILYEQVLRESIDNQDAENINITDIFHNSIKYLEQIRLAVNQYDKDNCVQDDPTPCIITK